MQGRNNVVRVVPENKHVQISKDWHGVCLVFHSLKNDL